jgi:uncharacterized protein
MPDYDKKSLLDEIQLQFRIDWHGIHGANHWARVLNHGLAIGKTVNADLLVVELFAFLHDSQRHNEHIDVLHGARAADYAAALNKVCFDLSANQLDTLCHAIRFHSDGLMHTNATIQTCWDADRLDLGRVGIIPSAKYISAQALTRLNSPANLMSQN